MNTKFATCCLLGDIEGREHFGYKKTTKTAFLKNKDWNFLQSLWSHNIEKTREALLFLSSQPERYHFFRISSDLFPLATLPEVLPFYKQEISSLQQRIQEIGSEVKSISANFRLVTHPGQFTILNSRNQKVIENSILDLQYHYDFMSAFNMPYSINIHLGSGPDKDDPLSHIHRFKVGWELLSKDIQKVLSLENDEKVADVSTIIHCYKTYGVKVCYDAHHQACFLSSSKHTGEFRPFVLAQDQIEIIEESWKDLNLPPTMHLSNRREIDSIGSKAFPHSDYLYDESFNNSAVRYLLNRGWDIECEAKAKFPAVVEFSNKISLL